MVLTTIDTGEETGAFVFLNKNFGASARIFDKAFVEVLGIARGSFDTGCSLTLILHSVLDRILMRILLLKFLEIS